MAARYITLDGTRYRAEFNWNAISAFLVESGRDTWDGLSCLKEIRPSDLAALALAGITEGERLDGKKLELSKEDIGRMLTTDSVRELIAIFVDHNSNGTGTSEPKQDATPAKKKSIFRRSGKSRE